MKGKPEITYYNIKCEECGEYFKKLQNHIIHTHKMSIAEYKEKWGLCRSQPLEALYVKEIRSKKTRSNGTIKNLDKREQSQFKKGQDNWWGRYKIPLQIRLRLKINSTKMWTKEKRETKREEARKQIKDWKRDKLGRFTKQAIN